MVTDTIQHASLYHALSPGIRAALDYLACADLMNAEPGRHELADGCYVMVQDYTTAPRGEKRWEAHCKYIDVQFIARGTEIIGCAECSTLRVVEAYNEEKDVEWSEGDGSFITMRTGTFMILFPHEPHMPGLVSGTRGPVRKIVVKVPVER